MSFDVIASLILGESSAICALRMLIAKVARTDLAVLIEGPTGVGKELVASALHGASNRTGAFVAFNVCAIPDAMFEDALFGHVRGAFTGASEDMAGFLTEAHQGTVFLDEIGGLPLSSQAKLLRAVETRAFRPVGAKSDRRSDFRVVSATNQALDQLIDQERFRADLAHRLGAVVVKVPSLADRLEDIQLLANHFLASTDAKRGQSATLSACAVRTLQRHCWSGNVRELRNVIARAAALGSGDVIDGGVIADALPYQATGHPIQEPSISRRAQLLELLHRFGWDTACVASHLGVHRGTVYRRMEQLGIQTSRWVTGHRERRESQAETDSHRSRYSTSEGEPMRIARLGAAAREAQA